jgi:glycosyltransferase involved in cell wall biosynthesis
VGPVLLYCFPKRSTFIDRDIALLAQRYSVVQHELVKGPSWHLPFRVLHQFAWLIRHRAWRRRTICHFSGYHAVLPTILSKRCYIILAGSDCAGIPAIGYGNHTRMMLGWATRFAARKATRLLPVHASLMIRTADYADIVPREQGILAFARGMRTPWTEVPYGFDDRFWCTDHSTFRSPDLFVCVAGPATPQNRVHQLKGVDLLLQIAERTPGGRFRIVGLAEPDAYTQAPANVRFTGRVSPEQLRDIYRSASFYGQLSLSEGMPNALCEAMLCGCIPLVSNVASMPSIVEGCGFILNKRDPMMGAALCNQLLALPASDRSSRSAYARERIARDFALERRANALYTLLATGA